MAGRLSDEGFTWICALHGTVSLPDEGDVEGELRLWYNESNNAYKIHARKSAGYGKLVCELLMFYSFTSKSALTKSKFYE